VLNAHVAQPGTARPVLQQAVVPLGALGGILLTGVVAFTQLGASGPIEAAFWVIDPTSVELHFAQHDGPERAARVTAILVRAGAVLAGLWVGETAVSAAFGGEIRSALGRSRDKRRIMNCTNHVIVCGYGTFGRTIATQLDRPDRRAVVIESTDAGLDRIRESDLLGLAGDARAEATLREANVERASAVVAAIDDSPVNLQIALTVAELAPEARIVVRLGDGEYEPLARRAGADTVIVPEVVSAQQVAEGITA
jgi:voltage-gated potassium channel